jgi:hypothetical protein
MDVDQIIGNSLKYPQSSWGKVATLGAIIIVAAIILLFFIYIGALINNPTAFLIFLILGVIMAIIAGLIVYGYILRTIKATIAGLDELPGFDNFGELIMDGLKVLVVNIVYGLIFAIVMLIPIGLMILMFGLIGALASPTGLANPSSMVGFGLLGWLIYLLVFIIYLVMIFIGLLYLIVVPMSIAHMAAQGKLGAAFSFSELRSKIDSIRWGKALVWVLANYFVFLVAILVSYILGMLLVGIILVPLLVIPFIGIYFARSTGLLYLNQ